MPGVGAHGVRCKHWTRTSDVLDHGLPSCTFAAGAISVLAEYNIYSLQPYTLLFVRRSKAAQHRLSRAWCAENHVDELVVCTWRYTFLVGKMM